MLRVACARPGFVCYRNLTPPSPRWPMGPLRASADYLPHLTLQPVLGRLKPQSGPCPQIRQPLYIQKDIPSSFPVCGRGSDPGPCPIPSVEPTSPDWESNQETLRSGGYSDGFAFRIIAYSGSTSVHVFGAVVVPAGLGMFVLAQMKRARACGFVYEWMYIQDILLDACTGCYQSLGKKDVRLGLLF